MRSSGEFSSGSEPLEGPKRGPGENSRMDMSLLGRKRARMLHGLEDVVSDLKGQQGGPYKSLIHLNP